MHQVLATVGLLAMVLLTRESPAAGETPASLPTTQEQGAAPSDSSQVQERAIRQGVGGGSGNCVCMRPLGQCVFSAQGGCVPHQGNPCNGGCIMKQPTPGIGRMAPATPGGAAQGPPGQGSMTK